MDNISLSIFVSLTILICVGFFLWSIINYEVAIFIVALSPFITSMSFFNNPINAGIIEVSIGSYMRITALLLMGIVGIIHFLRAKHYKNERLPIFLYLLGIYILIAIISTTYSIDKKYTIIRSTCFLALYGFLLGLHYYIKDIIQFKKIIDILFIIICLIIIATVIYFLIIPEKVWWVKAENRFRGMFVHPNTMGLFCMISYFVLLLKFCHSKSLFKWPIISFMIILFYIHLLTGSRGSILASIFGISIWFLVLKKKIRALFFLIIIGLIGITISGFDDLNYQRYNFLKTRDLSGRTKFWYSSYELILEKPLFGYGYGVAGKIWEDPRFYNSNFDLWSGSARTSLHNGYISITIGLGIIGFLVWLLSILIPLWRCTRSYADNYKAFLLAVILSCMLINTIETAITSGNHLASVIFWIAIISAGKLKTIDSTIENRVEIYNL